MINKVNEWSKARKEELKNMVGIFIDDLE